MVFDASKKTFDSLRGSPSNYGSWKLNLEAIAKSHSLWRFFQGRHPEPEYVDADAPTADEIAAHGRWEDLRDQAAGMLWLCIESDQQEHVRTVRHNPEAMWDALEALHQSKTAAPRFTALINLLGVQREDGEEKLLPFLARITKFGTEWRELLPHTLSLHQLVEEVQCIAAIRGITESHDSIASNLLQNNVGNLKLDAVRTAFHTEDNRPLPLGGTPVSAMRTSYTPTLASPPSSSSPDGPCGFCSREGHTETNCFSKQNASKKAKEKTASKREKSTPKEETARVASRLPPSFHALLDWIVDTGASRHMTPLRRLFTKYK